jgi:predicted MPP superfamily phosphohydrolase
MITRRRFVRGFLGTIGAGLLTGLYSWQVEPRWVDVVQQELPIAYLPADLDGRFLIQISDMHLSDRYDWRYQLEVMQMIQALEPDFVVYTGDFVTYKGHQQIDQLREVRSVMPIGRLGTAAILGNHDYGRGWSHSDIAQQITDLLTVRGITVLRNQAEVFGGLHIVGLDDFWGTNYAPKAVLAAVQPTEPTVVLCHNPDVADQPIWSDFRGWILAGHTHGGQVKPPFLPPPLLPVANKRYTAGVFAVGNGRFLYINRGLGNLWPVRFNVRPEVTVFRLKTTV